MKYRRDDEALKEALETYSLDGMPVFVPVFGEAVIVKPGKTAPVRETQGAETRLGLPMVYYVVQAKKPVSFEEWIRNRYAGPIANHAHEQMHLAAWHTLFRDKLPLMADYLMRKLEKGGELSVADMEYDSLIQRGCIDPDGKVSCYTFWQSSVSVERRQLERGMLVEYHFREEIYPGSILGMSKDKKIIYLELFTPMPALELSNFIQPEAIERGFYASYTHALGYGTYEAFEIAEEESGKKLIPMGVWDTETANERRIYTLKEFMPLSIIEDLCRAAYGDDPTAKVGGTSLCVAQSMILYVVPIRADAVGIFRPLPTGVVQTNAVVSYEDEDEG